MASKSRYFRLAGKQLRSQDINKVLTEEAQRRQEEQLDLEVQEIVQELDDLLVELHEKTSNRGRGFYAVRYNDPFEDAPIIVKKRRNSAGDLSYTIRVNNNKFNILDQGAPARHATGDKPMLFPRYTKNLTRANSLKLASSPVEILDQRTVQNRNDLNQQIFGQGWVQVSEVKAIKPRNFILNIAKKVRSRFQRSKLVDVTVRKS